MINLLKKVQVVALALAAAAAFAFNMPEQGTLKGQVSEGVWVDLSPNDLYECNPDATICTARFNDQGEMISQVSGQFIQL
ncbi:hypothetical protein [Anditalea andensis]|uniref:Uncharacterized protein n=1 Tax=Anditalea andensis TaxID=1048983 RepID=A0A074KP51_9BACT|nr:hypothetical protein [Anditalea andensis]KEO71711.1 hypothetical protein EL17_23205 [Anditalea andensis]